MNMFAKSEANSIEEYLLMMPGERKKEFEKIFTFIKKILPKLPPYFASNMIGFGTFYYLDQKKQKKGWPIISLANQKNYISIYICAMIEDKAAVKMYLNDLGKLSKSLSCIRFKNISEIKLDTLKIVLKLAEQKPGIAGARLVEK